MPRCSSCGKEIEFVKTAGGKLMPVVAKPEKRFVLDEGQSFGGLFAPTGRIVDCYQSHFIDCPQAAEHRHRGK
jgi:hypothetical protein